MISPRSPHQSQPERFGLPPQAELDRYRIWDSYLTPTMVDPDGTRLMRDISETLPRLTKASIRRFCVFLHVGLGTAEPATEQWVREHPSEVDAPLRAWPERALGLIQLNAADVQGSLNAINRWIADGPMIGVYFPGDRRNQLPCNHAHYDPLVTRVAELGGLIMQHTWATTGGKEHPGVSTPADLAELASRFPQVRFACAHAGGEWETGIRSIRAYENVSIETSGFDPTAGFIEMAIRELGERRIVFGSHLPSRSLGTELGKVLGARISESARLRILGENLREWLAPILRSKGLATEP
jgi:predicted TIM-barrel fold metal-dependent hydrolase